MASPRGLQYNSKALMEEGHVATDRNTSCLLIVEDEEEIRELLRERLAMAGHGVIGVACGDDALRVIEREPVDVIILDAGLPGMDGFELLESLRRTHPPTRLPVVMLTGLSGREDIVRGLRLGANDYVAKPLDFPILLARIQTQIEMKRAVDARARLEHELTDRAAELERANRALADANARMKSDLAWAARLQRSLVPTAAPAVPGVEFAWAYQPCEQLGGDLLNVFAIDDDHVGMYMIDVSGHGMKAALLSVQVSRLLALVPDQPCLVRRRAGGVGPFEPTPAVEVASELNRRFPLDESFDLYFTLFYGVLDTRTLELRYVAAGSPGPIHAPAGGEAVDLSRPVFAIGWVSEPGYEEQRLMLRAGDRLYLYSDGVSDARDAGNERFGVPRMAQVAGASGKLGIDEALARVMEAANVWRAGAVDDDVSALALEVRAAAVGRVMTTASERVLPAAAPLGAMCRVN
jgi:sigma-B regulation protein RsbU (phosphoserine phosphatase)